MVRFVALLRAINVGGRAPVSMAALRELATGLGLEDPQTILQSGNLVFRAKAATASSLERTLEEAVAARFGVQTDIVVRTSNDWQRIIARNPFPREATDDPGHLLVMPLKGVAKVSDVQALQASVKGREVVRADGAQLYLVYPDGVGRSRLTAVRIEKAVGARGTARNWNTVLKLGALCGDR
jgi:uncharacterized protein (DUF1697 family)